MDSYRDEIARLQAENENERALRAEAEADADAWRQKTIDVKLDSIHKRMKASAIIEEVVVDSHTNRALAAQDESASSRLKNELANLKGQREMLLRTLEDMQKPEEETDEDKQLSLEEKLEKERGRRRAAEGLAKALRTMLDDGETDRAMLQEDAEKLKTDNERSRSLLAAAQDILVRNNIAPLASSTTRGSTKRITEGGETGTSKNTIVSVGLLVAVVAVLAIVYRKKKQQ